MAAVIGVGTANPSACKGGGQRIGYTHGRMYRGNARVKLVAAADINPENLAAFLKQFDVPHGFADYRAMLAQVRPDVVSIGTYVGLHRAMIEDCARAGVKAIFCEKPFVASPVELDAVRKTLEQTRAKLMIAHVRRYRPAFDRARRLIADGAIGQPVMFMAGIEDWDLSEWGSHWLDMFRFLQNDMPVKWVMGQARIRDQRCYGHATEEHAVAYFGFEDGCRGLLDGGKALAGDASMTLVGTEGTIRVFGESSLAIDTSRGRSTEEFSDPASTGWDDLWSPICTDLVNWLDGGPEPRISFTHTRGSAELNLAAYVSMIRGDRIDLPLHDKTDEWPLEILARRARLGEPAGEPASAGGPCGLP